MPLLPAASGQAPGKVILFGEHAVVYGQPAIAVPVTDVQAIAEVEASAPGQTGLLIDARDLEQHLQFDDLPDDHPLAAAVRSTCRVLGIEAPTVRLTIRSTIPVASGLGSGAAVTAAIARALSAYAGRPLDDAAVSELAFEVERIHHGTPSGIDNTVVAFGRPVYFVRGQPPERLRLGGPLHILIGDTGASSPTKTAVSDVRRMWERAPAQIEAVFRAIGEIVRQARAALETGAVDRLGPLMNENHAHLRTLEVSSPELERLISAAVAAGASGAKLSGGGRGGNMIALADSRNAEAVTAALRQAGAVKVISTVVHSEGN